MNERLQKKKEKNVSAKNCESGEFPDCFESSDKSIDSKSNLSVEIDSFEN